MSVFLYKAITHVGSKTQSAINANSKNEAIAKIEEMGLVLISLKKAKFFSKNKSSSIGVSLNSRDKMSFFVHIAEMAHAGMNTKQTLDLLIDLSDNKKLLYVGKVMKKKVDQGTQLSESMREVGCFGEMFSNLMFVAEKTNSLEKVSNMIIEYIKWNDEIRRNVKSAIIKPLISLVFALSLIIGTSIIVLPKLIVTLEQLNGGKMPEQTVYFVKFTGFLGQKWYLFPSIFLTMSFLNYVPRLLNWKTLSIGYDKIKLYFPMFGKLFLKIEMARFSAFLSILINSGYKANEAISLSPRVIVNRYIKNALEFAAKKMESGSTIYAAFSSYSVFPKFFLSMIGIGEKVNDVAGTIGNIKDAYDKDVKATSEFIISSVKPIITVFIGFMIGWMAFAVFFPMYQTVSSISDGVK